MEPSNSTLFLCHLLSRGYKPEYYSLLEEEMFEPGRDRKVFKALKDGYQFSSDDLSGLREVTGITRTELVDLEITRGQVKGWVVESDVLEFAKDYRKQKIRELVSEGKVEEALELIHRKDAPQTSVIEDYKKSLQEKRSRADSGLLGLPTGMPSLDAVTSGLQPNKVWIVGGYNAYGKTYFMTNIVNRLVDMGRRICVVTLEMTKEDILDRMIAEKLGLSVYSLAKTINRGVVEKQVEVMKEKIENGNLIIIDSLYNLEDMVSRLKIENSNRKIDVMFLDFLQLVRDSKAKSNYESLSKVSARLQELTKELGMCSVLLSQISNEAQKSGSSGVYGFKGAGEIGQIADVAIRIRRYKDEATGEFTSKYDLDLVKKRSGETGLISCNIEFPGGSIIQNNMLDNSDDI